MSPLSMVSMSPYGNRLRRQRRTPSPRECHASGKRAMRSAADSTSIRNALSNPAPALRTSGWPDRARSRQSRETGPSRPVFGDNVAQIFGREFTAPVGCQAVARLPRPQSIDIGIGTVQAVEHVLNQRDAVLRGRARACSVSVLALLLIFVPCRSISKIRPPDIAYPRC